MPDRRERKAQQHAARDDARLLHLAVRQVLNEHDVMALIRAGCPEDEYDPEVPGVIAALRSSPSPQEAAPRIRQVCEHWFGADSFTSDPPSRWDSLARDLWEAVAPFRGREVFRPTSTPESGGPG